jgi:hypothetical protein
MTLCDAAAESGGRGRLTQSQPDEVPAGKPPVSLTACQPARGSVTKLTFIADSLGPANPKEFMMQGIYGACKEFMMLMMLVHQLQHGRQDNHATN